MAPSEYATMEPSELHDKLIESRKELFNLRFQKATGQLDNTARLGHLRKDIARILTVLRQQELGIEEPVLLPVAGEVAGAKLSGRSARRAETGGAEVDEVDEEVDDMDEVHGATGATGATGAGDGAVLDEDEEEV